MLKAKRIYIIDQNHALSGETISTNTEKYLQHEYVLNEYSMRSRLTIRDFSEKDDIGEYKCVCKNEINNSGGDRVEGSVFLTLERGKRHVIARRPVIFRLILLKNHFFLEIDC
jgi:hypothetical protein